MSVLTIPDRLKEEYPFEPKRLKLSCEFEMSYVDEGEGFPVLMVHGNPTWSFYYRNVIKKLRGKFRCIAVDHIGCGLSDKPGSNYSYRIKQRIQDLGELIDHLGLERFDIVVHDWGGVIGLGAALQRFEKLRRVTILNTAAFVDSRIPARISLCRNPIFGKLLVQGLNGFAGPAAWMSVKKKPLNQTVKEGMLLPYGNWSNRRAVYEFVKDIPMHVSHPSFNDLLEVENNLLKLRQRDVTILWGGKDFCFNIHFYDRWQRFLPDATAFRYNQAGHYILEDETESCCEAIYQMADYDED
ncbi:alpha/beta fold hydrolase [Pelagicoccus sp. SDUM812002]|uniref:alpha/beta fold hydrolase n=1 Tax=Pelagicoccus sp. SDUM812002 TaxID=3041266 RepID=UPI00280D93E1|nr:alpha/beta fold hydrolase [Pelagicoccus sp. SDUM812002]MDQ8185342.1 alpha/beta fold hydrolase [Pelagicoccus sp. SDUM812002]